jgi:hypothetical protein
MQSENKPVRHHQWWWTYEPRHAPCPQCDEGDSIRDIPWDLIWGMGGGIVDDDDFGE